MMNGHHIGDSSVKQFWIRGLTFNRTPDNPKANYYNNRGSAYATKGQYDQAISDFDKAIKLDPKYTGAYINIGRCYKGKKQYVEAIAKFDKALELDKDLVDGFMYRGTTYALDHQYDKAIADFDKAIKTKA